jgi:hypothetical protein
MYSHKQILINPKSYGLVHDVCVKKICVCCTVFADASFSCSFPNNLTNVIINPKTRFCFGRLGYTLLEMIIVCILIIQIFFSRPRRSFPLLHLLTRPFN